MGVPNIWLIDPIRRSASSFGANGLKEADPLNLTIANSPIHLDLTEAFSAPRLSSIEEVLRASDLLKALDPLQLLWPCLALLHSPAHKKSEQAT